MPGPLAGLQVIELAGLGPAPHAAMVLADLGADVTRVARPQPAPARAGAAALTSPGPVIGRGRATVHADLKDDSARREVLELVTASDVLLDPYRPGVAERLGVGPQACMERNPRLVYARITGWGQDGPLAQRAGHDINYIAITGALHAIGEGDQPVPPLNLVGDFGGGSMLGLVGILAALWERERSGLGQVIDVAMVDGACLLMQDQWDGLSQHRISSGRQSNILDGGAPYYRAYRCSDGRYVAVGAIEQQFYHLLLVGLGLAGDELPDRLDRANWPALRKRFAAVFSERTRDEWAETFAATDACVTPVLSLEEVPGHPQIAARQSVRLVDGVTQASPAPRFSRSQEGWGVDREHASG
jgi:alpha-methylacyl-CoA racemase